MSDLTRDLSGVVCLSHCQDEVFGGPKPRQRSHSIVGIDPKLSQGNNLLGCFFAAEDKA